MNREKVASDLNKAFGTSATAYLQNDERELVINISDPAESIEAMLTTLKSDSRLGIERVLINKGSAEHRELTPEHSCG